MNEFYHVSRNDISYIKSFELFEGHLEDENLNSSSELRKHKQNIFPNGISKYGNIYLNNTFKSSTYPNLTKNAFIIETTFELVRRLKFPEKNSRFTSSFACDSLENAKKIKKKLILVVMFLITKNKP